MVDSLTATQDEAITLLKSLSPLKWVEQGIPDGTNVERRADGKIKPYFAYQFGDTQQEGSRSFHGPKGDDYVVPLYVQCVAPSAGEARAMANLVTMGALGATFTYGGSLRKRPGGALWPIIASNAAIEAYEAAISFGLLVQLIDDV